MSSESFESIALVAARAFLDRGYRGVSLRALAQEIGIKAASLYYHCPDGKAELFERSLLFYFDEYRTTLEGSVGRASFPEDLYRMAESMLELGPIDLRRIAQQDATHLDAAQVKALFDALHRAVLHPFEERLQRASASGKARSRLDASLAAACIVSLVDNLGFMHLPAERDATERELDDARKLVRSGLALLVDGLRA